MKTKRNIATLLIAGLVGALVGVAIRSMTHTGRTTVTHVRRASDSDGVPIPVEEIALPSAEGATQFSLGAGRLLEIRSTVPARPDEWQTIHELVLGVYRRHEQVSGRPLEKGVLLYLVELDEIPKAYQLTASYPNDSPWEEVAFGLTKAGEHAVHGESSTLHAYLFDTLPHELAHDLLRGLVRHDLRFKRFGGFAFPSNHTRWFLDGVCELLTKDFARSQSEDAYRRYLRMRKPGSVLSRPEVRDEIFRWEQHGSSDIDSDLYGAAYLILSVWTAAQPLDEILGQLGELEKPATGDQLTAMLEAALGEDLGQVLDRAQRLGERLALEIETD